VILFRAGEIHLVGNEWTPDAHILSNVRTRRGEEIASDTLVEDINWLNLNPYRNITVLFEPGRKFGESNLTLRSREVRPWGVYAGYANSGTKGTDRNRIFVGVNTANIPRLDHQLSYQLTTSPNFWSEDGDILGGAEDADYVSHSGVYFVPLPWRHKLTLQASLVDTKQSLQAPFSQDSKALQTYAEYAIPLRIHGEFQVEIYGGGAYKRQKTDLFFDDLPANSTEIEIGQAVTGVRASVTDRLGALNLDIRGVFSPGDAFDHNTDAAFVAASGNPDARARYAYFYGSVHRVTQLLASPAITLDTRALFQTTGDALPEIEQLAIGGSQTVRGYSELEVAGERGFVVSNELRFPAFSFLASGRLGLTDRAQLFVFYDYGRVHQVFEDKTFRLAAAGVGLDYRLGDKFAVSLSYGQALRDALLTKEGDQRVHAKATVRY
jgi:hemolysin activation/secretion protein